MKKFVCGMLCLSVLLAAIGCGVSNRTIVDAEKRIEVLRQKGVPDSSLSRAKVFLYQARDAKQRGNTGLAKLSADSMLVLVAKAEEQYAQNMELLKPYVDSLKNVFKEVGKELTGLQKETLDSMIAVVDSFASINWLLQAEAIANEIDTLIPRLTFDEERARELSKRVPGTWVSTQVTKHEHDKTVHAVEKKTFQFNRDGSCKLIEEKKGKSGPYLKEDWMFRSNGTWGLKGDTIKLFIDRFATVKQDFEEYHNRDGKVTWEKKKHPTYDSTITDGSQNRWITFADLKSDFVRR